LRRVDPSHTGSGVASAPPGPRAAWAALFVHLQSVHSQSQQVLLVQVQLGTEQRRQ